MSWKGPTFVFTLSAAIVGTFWWTQFRSLQGNEDLLFSKIEAAIASNPPSANEVVAAFDLPESCLERTCFLEPSTIAGIDYGGGDLRDREEEGLIFVLEEISGTCIRTQRVRAHYNTEDPHQACSHGGCWYTSANYSWGFLSFGLEKPSSECISSVVINSELIWRTDD